MARPILDVDLSAVDRTRCLCLAKHANFILAISQKRDETLDFLRLSGVYWSLTALDLISQLDNDRLSKEEIVQFVQSCQQEDGGLSPSPRHDSHLLSCLSGVQVLILLDRLDAIRVDDLVAFIVQRQQPDGSFAGDKWGELDTRFSLCAIGALRLLNRLDSSAVDTLAARQHVLRCSNLDGGFGTRPYSESHAGQIYCCLATLSLLDSLRLVDVDNTAWWLAERQLPSGGLNGRPEKAPDVCYSWWVLASLKLLGRLSWIDSEALTDFILASQDDETGGFADRPGDMPDPFHTLFGLAGLSLLHENRPVESSGSTAVTRDPSIATIRRVNPVLCMPEDVLSKRGIDLQQIT